MEQAANLSRRSLIRALEPYAKRSNTIGFSWFLQEFVGYWFAIAVVLFVPTLPAKIAASIFAGFKLAGFYTLAHDAAHRILVKSKRLNFMLGMLLSVPAVQNRELWILEHHGVHHPDTNRGDDDFYRPLSKAQFDVLPAYRRLYERFIRSPMGIGFAVHFLFSRILDVRVFPTKSTPEKNRPAAWGYFAVIMTFQAAFIAMLCLAPRFAPVSLAQALSLGYVLPFFLYCLITGSSLYLMHNHADIPWFEGKQAGNADQAAALCATHLTTSKILARITFNVFAHSAHHAHAGIPVYRLSEAQTHLDKLLGDKAVVEKLSLSHVLKTTRVCKLYDYENHQWLDFDGNPTTPIIKSASSA